MRATFDAGKGAWLVVVGIALALASGSQSLAQAGWVISFQKISDTEGGFLGELEDFDRFGTAVAWLGDLDGDGVGDVAVGARGDDDGGGDHGAVWVLFLKPDATVKAHQKISETEGGFSGDLDESDHFGISIAALGDLDGDGVGDLAVGAEHDDDGGVDHGAVYVLFLNADGTVKSHQKISDLEGGFTGKLGSDNFGRSVASLGDFDGDGIAELAVGAPMTAGSGHDGVWVLFLNADGTVRTHQLISDFEGGFTGELESSDYMGTSVAALGDLNGDGVPDLAAGAPGDNDGNWSYGAVWIMFLNADGTVKIHQKISAVEGGFAGELTQHDWLGHSVASPGDLDGDGIIDLAVGAPGDDDDVDAEAAEGDDTDPGVNRGAVWVLMLNADGTVKAHQKISNKQGGFYGDLHNHDKLGNSIAALGDFDGDGRRDLISGTPSYDDGGDVRGAVWMLFLDDSACPADASNDGHVGPVDLVA